MLAARCQASPTNRGTPACWRYPRREPEFLQVFCLPGSVPGVCYVAPWISLSFPGEAGPLPPAVARWPDPIPRVSLPHSLPGMGAEVCRGLPPSLVQHRAPECRTAQRWGPRGMGAGGVPHPAPIPCAAPRNRKATGLNGNAFGRRTPAEVPSRRIAQRSGGIFCFGGVT
jgi:hypothetical protein